MKPHAANKKHNTIVDHRLHLCTTAARNGRCRTARLTDQSETFIAIPFPIYLRNTIIQLWRTQTHARSYGWYILMSACVKGLNHMAHPLVRRVVFFVYKRAWSFGKRYQFRTNHSSFNNVCIPIAQAQIIQANDKVNPI